MAIVSAEKEAKLMAEYDKWLRAAKGSAPEKPDYKDGDTLEQKQKKYADFAARMDAFNTNPGVAILRSTREAVAKFYEGKDLNNPDIRKKFDENVDMELARRRGLFKDGLDKGNEEKSNFQTAFEELGKGGSILGFIKHLFMSIPIVGDVLASGGKMLMSLFSGKPMGPLTAFGDIQAERALAGGLDRLGFKDANTVKVYTAMAINGTVPESKAPPAPLPVVPGPVLAPPAPGGPAPGTSGGPAGPARAKPETEARDGKAYVRTSPALKPFENILTSVETAPELATLKGKIKPDSIIVPIMEKSSAAPGTPNPVKALVVGRMVHGKFVADGMISQIGVPVLGTDGTPALRTDGKPLTEQKMIAVTEGFKDKSYSIVNGALNYENLAMVRELVEKRYNVKGERLPDFVVSGKAYEFNAPEPEIKAVIESIRNNPSISGKLKPGSTLMVITADKSKPMSVSNPPLGFVIGKVTEAGFVPEAMIKDIGVPPTPTALALPVFTQVLGRGKDGVIINDAYKQLQDSLKVAVPEAAPKPPVSTQDVANLNDLKKLAAERPLTMYSYDSKKNLPVSDSMKALLDKSGLKDELKDGKQFVVVKNGDNLIVYTGNEVMTDSGRYAFKVDKALRLDGETFTPVTSKLAPKDTMIPISATAPQIQQDAFDARLKGDTFTEALAVQPKPVKESLGTIKPGFLARAEGEDDALDVLLDRLTLGELIPDDGERRKLVDAVGRMNEEKGKYSSSSYALISEGGAYFIVGGDIVDGKLQPSEILQFQNGDFKPAPGRKEYAPLLVPPSDSPSSPPSAPPAPPLENEIKLEAPKAPLGADGKPADLKGEDLTKALDGLKNAGIVLADRVIPGGSKTMQDVLASLSAIMTTGTTVETPPNAPQSAMPTGTAETGKGGR